MPESVTVKRWRSRSISTPICAPGSTTTPLSIIALRITARSPIFTPGIKTELSTNAPVPTWTSYEATVRLTWPPEMIEPAPTIESCAIPFSENFAGGSDGGFVRSRH
jgi:hypothetical protein